MVPAQLSIFVFLCIIMGILELLCDISKEKIKSVILLLIVITNMVLAVVIDNKFSLIPIGLNVIFIIGYIISIGRKTDKKVL